MANKHKRVYDAAKRAFDVISASAGLILLSPVVLVTATAVYRELGSPILFRQERPGLNGKPFELIKFRTMLPVDEDRGLVTNEQRMSPFGQRLRSWSLDELPTLWNVVKGDMSIIGPRPLLTKYLPLYTREQARRHEVRPGVTGLAQASGRNAISWEEKFDLDIYYVDHRSFGLDLKILGKTIVSVLRKDGISSKGYVVGSPFEGSRDSHG